MGWQRFNRGTNIFEVSDNNGASWQPLVIAAAGLTLPANIAYTNLGNTFYVEQDFVGGSGTAYYNAPIEIVLASYPRIGFHWPGVVASSIGMDSAGIIRTFDNPGTGYEKFQCSTIIATGIRTTGSLRAEGPRDTLPYGSTGPAVELFYQSGIAYVHGYNTSNSTYVPLRLVGSTIDMTASLTVTGSISASGAIYPGNIAGGTQANWYLLGHGTYGLYSNTGLYLEYGSWASFYEARNHVRAAGPVYDYGRAQPMGHWTAYTPTMGANHGASAITSQLACTYMLVGKTCTIQFYLQVYNNTATTAVTATLPPGIVSTGYAGSAMLMGDLGFGMCQTGPGSGFMAFYKDVIGTTYMAPATRHYAGVHTFQIN